MFLPNECRVCGKIRLPKSQYDYAIFKSPILLIAELKSTAQKSISFDEKIIKENQIKSLDKFNEYPYVIAGFIMNFRAYDNKTYFVGIDDFIKYKKESGRKSIPLDYCKEIGIEIQNKIKKVNHKYDLDDMFTNIYHKYYTN